MAASLKDLRFQCKTVKDSFKKLLTVPDMQLLEVDNPFWLEDKEKRLLVGASIDKVDRINLREMIVRFRNVLVLLILYSFTGVLCTRLIRRSGVTR